MNIVECSQVKKTYRQGEVEVLALNGVDLSIEQGGFLALAGPSGSGKTTMLNIIGGLDRADCGRECFGGYEPVRACQPSVAQSGIRFSGLQPHPCSFRYRKCGVRHATSRRSDQGKTGKGPSYFG